MRWAESVSVAAGTRWVSISLFALSTRRRRTFSTRRRREWIPLRKAEEEKPRDKNVISSSTIPMLASRGRGLALSTPTPNEQNLTCDTGAREPRRSAKDEHKSSTRGEGRRRRSKSRKTLQARFFLKMRNRRVFSDTLIKKRRDELQSGSLAGEGGLRWPFSDEPARHEDHVDARHL